VIRLGGRRRGDWSALLWSLIVAAIALAALAFLVDRLERLAQAQPLGTERRWAAASGQELRLGGLEPGPLLAVETGAGGGLTVQAHDARLDGGNKVRNLLWMTGKGAADDDNKPGVQISLLPGTGGGAVILSRSGEAERPQLRIRAEGAALRVEAGVAIGESLLMPSTTIVADGRRIEAAEPVFAFTVPPGGAVAVEFPAFPDGTPSGVKASLGGVREQEQDVLLPLRETAIAREGAGEADKLACAAPEGRYALRPVLRPTLEVTPAGRDCLPGALQATGITIGRDFVAVDLSGSAYILTGGKPGASIWSWAMGNPVLEFAINKALPLAISAIFGIVTFRRRTAAGRGATKEEAEAQPASAAPKSKPKPKPRTGKRPRRSR
jgi:hypothetical protein